MTQPALLPRFNSSPPALTYDFSLFLLVHGNSLDSLSLTCFVGGDGELVAGLALADQVLGEHADVVGGGGVQVDDGGLVELW